MNLPGTSVESRGQRTWRGIAALAAMVLAVAAVLAVVLSGVVGGDGQAAVGPGAGADARGHPPESAGRDELAARPFTLEPTRARRPLPPAAGDRDAAGLLVPVAARGAGDSGGAASERAAGDGNVPSGPRGVARPGGGGGDEEPAPPVGEVPPGGQTPPDPPGGGGGPGGGGPPGGGPGEPPPDDHPGHGRDDAPGHSEEGPPGHSGEGTPGQDRKAEQPD